MKASTETATFLAIAKMRRDAKEQRDLAHRVDSNGIGCYVIRELINSAESLEAAARYLDSGGHVKDAV